jgi:hypothetical protein
MECNDDLNAETGTMQTSVVAARFSMPTHDLPRTQENTTSQQDTKSPVYEAALLTAMTTLWRRVYQTRN